MTIGGVKMTVSDTNISDVKRIWITPKPRTYFIICLIVAVLVVISGISGYLIGANKSATDKYRNEPPDPITAPRPSSSKIRTFKRAAVCTDAPQCSKIGNEIISKNGSAVDAAIAAMFCNGLLNIQSMGLGGGFFMMVYIKNEYKTYSVVARETAPAAATENMFQGSYDKATKGPLAVGVPGELRGMWAAYQRWGSLPWAELIKPSIDICENGFIQSKVLYDGLLEASSIKVDPILRKMFYDEDRQSFYPPGTRIFPSTVYCGTLKRIAATDGNELYNGTLAMKLARDLKKVGSIITIDDLNDYKALIKEPLAVSLGESGDTLYTTPLPSSGVILGYILNILSGYKFNDESLTTTDGAIKTYHRIIEAFKFAYAARTKLGDEDFLNLKELVRNLTSVEYAEATRSIINDSITSNDTKMYGAELYTKDDTGTAHISIIAPNGDAVSITSSVNYYFGAGFTSPSTGIILNNVMDDFSSPGITNYFGVKPSPANFIKPGKRPLSSMSPSIVIDGNGNAKLVIGASGGTKICTAVALVTMRTLWFGENVKEAIDSPRFHHQVVPMAVQYEYGITENVVSGLRAKGHAMTRYRDRGSIVCALYRNITAIYANADFRKGGDVEGLN